jgi:hypothetical protein
MKKLVLVLCLLIPSASLFAQQGSVGVPGFSFVAPLKVAVGTDNNFLVDRTPPVERVFVLSLPPSIQPLAPDIRPKRLSDQVMTLTLPKLAFQNYGRRHELVLTYVPQIEMFRTNSDQNSWSHDAAVNFTYHLSRSLQFSVGDAYRTSKDPALTLQNVFLLLPRNRYEENGIRGQVDFKASGVTDFQVRYDATRTTYGITDPFQTRIFDNTAKGIAIQATHFLSRTQRLRVKTSFYKFQPINQAKPLDDAVDTTRAYQHLMRSVDVQYRLRTTPSTYLSFQGGATQIIKGLTYTLGVGADKRFGKWWLGGGYTRSLSFIALGPTFFANGLNPQGFYDAVYISTRAWLTDKSTFQFRLTGARGSADGLAKPNQSLMGFARFDYRLNDRTVWFATMDRFQQNKNDYVATPLMRNRFMTGIEFSITSERERRTNRLNEDALYVPITDHTAGRRDKVD